MKFKRTIKKFWIQLKKYKKHSIVIIGAATLYVTLFTVILSEYNLRENTVHIERTSIENLVINNNLEAALRRYKYASLMKLHNKPLIYLPVISWIGLTYTTPNKEPLWLLIKSALDRHSYQYIIYGIPPNKGATGWRADDTPGTPNIYLGINLAHIDLRGTKLTGFNFTLVDLYKSDLRGADLSGADFSNAFLYDTDIRECNIGQHYNKQQLLTRLDISDSNAFLFEKVKYQFQRRPSINNSNFLRYRLDHKQINYLLSLLVNNDWQARYVAVFSLTEIPDSEKTQKIKDGLLDLLIREVVFEKNGRKYVKVVDPNINLSADLPQPFITFDKYITFLISSVAQNRDKRAISIFIRLDRNKYEFLTNALVDIGEVGIDSILYILKSGTPALKRSAAWTIGNMIWREQPNYISDTKIRLRIINELGIALDLNAHPTDALLEWEEVQMENLLFVGSDSLYKKMNGLLIEFMKNI